MDVLPLDMLPPELIATLKSGEQETIAAAVREAPALLFADDGEGMTLLHWAVAKNLEALTAELLAHPDIPLEARQHLRGRTALHLAANKGQLALIRLLVNAGADVQAVDLSGCRPLDLARTPAAVAVLQEPTLHPEHFLKHAIKAGEVLRVRRLMTVHAELGDCTDDSGTPLHWAIATRNQPMVEALIGLGVPIDRPDHQGNSPLHLAVYHADSALTYLLLASGANPAWPDLQDFTPLHVNAGHGDATRTLTLPPPPGIAPIAPTSPTQTDWVQCAFDFSSLLAAPSPAAQPPAQPPAGVRDDLACATSLIEAGADVNARARGGVTPLHLAAHLGDAEMVALLLRHSADADPPLPTLRATPAHLAAAGGHVDILALLRAAGANLQARDIYGRTAEELLLIFAG